MHLKRQSIKKSWPIPRKGTKYLAVAAHEKNQGIPLSVVMRDILGLTRNKKELQKLINDKKVLVNGKTVRDVKYPILLFDSISFPEVKKHYRAVLKDKKMSFEEESESAAKNRAYRVMNKKQLKGNKTQLNLSNGKNLLSSEKVDTGDFVVLNFDDNKIVKKISLQKGTEAIVVKGKHMGMQGKIKEITGEGNSKIAEIVVDGEGIKVDIENLFAR